MKILMSLFFFSTTVLAQTGGTYRLENSVIASGGGSSSASSYALDTTLGQPSAGGPLLGGAYTLHVGFLTPTLAPTAASVSVSGRVTTADGRGINNIDLAIQNSAGQIRRSITGSFGYYSFPSVMVGESYLITVTAKQFVFANPTRAVNVDDKLTDVDFVAEP